MPGHINEAVSTDKCKENTKINKQTKPPPPTKANSPNSSCSEYRGHQSIHAQIKSDHRGFTGPPTKVTSVCCQATDDRDYRRRLGYGLQGASVGSAGDTSSIRPEPRATSHSGKNKHWSVGMPRPSGWSNPTGNKQCQTCLQWAYPGHHFRFHHIWDCDLPQILGKETWVEIASSRSQEDAQQGKEWLQPQSPISGVKLPCPSQPSTVSKTPHTIFIFF